VSYAGDKAGNLEKMSKTLDGVCTDDVVSAITTASGSKSQSGFLLAWAPYVVNCSRKMDDFKRSIGPVAAQFPKLSGSRLGIGDDFNLTLIRATCLAVVKTARFTDAEVTATYVKAETKYNGNVAAAMMRNEMSSCVNFSDPRIAPLVAKVVGKAAG
jgi:hypothetical protein